MMNDVSSRSPFDMAGGKTKIGDLEPLSKADGYRWGIIHLEYVKRELMQLEKRALARRDVQLLHDIVASKLRTIEVEDELRKKLMDVENTSTNHS